MVFYRSLKEIFLVLIVKIKYKRQSKYHFYDGGCQNTVFKHAHDNCLCSLIKSDHTLTVWRKIVCEITCKLL